MREFEAISNESQVGPKVASVSERSELDEALYQERELLNQAIVTLEILARGKGKRRGRPPRWLREGRPGRPSRPGSRDSSSVNRDS